MRVDYWREGYDWQRCEAMLNGFGQHRTIIDGQGIRFRHVRSPEPDALPLIVAHGWPGSVIEFHKVNGPLTDPAAHCGGPRDAFHLVVPTLPGFGFSDKLTEPGWGVPHIADAQGANPARPLCIGSAVVEWGGGGDGGPVLVDGRAVGAG